MDKVPQGVTIFSLQMGSAPLHTFGAFWMWVLNNPIWLLSVGFCLYFIKIFPYNVFWSCFLLPQLLPDPPHLFPIHLHVLSLSLFQKKKHWLSILFGFHCLLFTLRIKHLLLLLCFLHAPQMSNPACHLLWEVGLTSECAGSKLCNLSVSGLSWGLRHKYESQWEHPSFWAWLHQGARSSSFWDGMNEEGSPVTLGSWPQLII